MEEAPDVLAGLRGRRVWMVNGSAADCARAEGLGMVVSCEPERPGAARGEVVSWCPEVSRASLEALREALGGAGWSIRSWEDQPEEADAAECGTFAEVTVRY